MDEMAKKVTQDGILLLPCADGGPKEFKHSVTCHFEIENVPLRINTLLFIGSRGRLRNHLLKTEGLDLRKDPGFDEFFSGVSGVTFPCTDGAGCGFVVVWMPKFDWSLTDIETLSHECLHAAVMVMRMSGQKPRIFSTKDECAVDDEGLAYRQSSMLSAMLTELAKRQQKLYRKSFPAKGV